MDVMLFKANTITMLMNIFYTLIALILALAAVRFIDKVVYPDIDFVAEMKKGNIAAAIFVSTILIFVAIVIGLTLR